MKSKYVIKNLIVLFVCILLVFSVTICAMVAINKINQNLKNTKNELDITKNELKNISKLATSYHNDLCQTEDRLTEIINRNELLQDEVDAMHGMILDLKNEEYELIYIGNYKLTHYCCEKRPHICGTGAGITATGTQVTAGRTIAVDPSVIPYGTKVYIEGYGWRVAEDCGGAVVGKHIDVAVETHSQAMSMGTVTGGVWVLVMKTS
jgi:3D (Asp-Asp-Asp) domain-containing protein